MFLAARFIRSIHPDPSGIPWAGSGGEVLGFFYYCLYLRTPQNSDHRHFSGLVGDTCGGVLYCSLPFFPRTSGASGSVEHVFSTPRRRRMLVLVKLFFE